jgi:hypothetical protein
MGGNLSMTKANDISNNRVSWIERRFLIVEEIERIESIFLNCSQSHIFKIMIESIMMRRNISNGDRSIINYLKYFLNSWPFNETLGEVNGSC